MQNITKRMALFGLGLLLLAPASIHAQALAPNPSLSLPGTGQQVVLHVFMRDGCTYCHAQEEFLTELATRRSDFSIMWHDIATSEQDAQWYERITKEKNVPRVTPITIIGNTLIQGFDAPETTGARIAQAIDTAKLHEEITMEDFLSGAGTEIAGSAESACSEGDAAFCVIEEPLVNEYTFKLPLLGITDLRSFSLATLSVVLGLVDGFNPCAMWVLVTFLLVLMQIGSRKRMAQIAGLFILAEGIMYAFILNVWYATWDFVQLDAIVTPAVGVLALGSGAYFLYRWRKDRKNNELVCDVTDLETQSKITQKINHFASAPMTLGVVLGIIALAFSVNVIEFACSIGIPQAFTKILELNHLSTLGTQGYIALYTLLYMADDIILFGLALWGFEKIHTTGHKYSHLSMLIGGVLMLLIGVIMLLAPGLLTL